MKNNILIIFVCAYLILLQSGCSKNQNLLLKESIYFEDALNLISVMEDTHPSFALGDINDNYEEGKQDFIDSINKNTTKDEFKYLLQKYLNLLGDGHTKLKKRNINK